MADTNRTPPRSKTVKRPRYEQKFKLEYSSEFKFISKSSAGESYAFCTLCWSDICIAHSGRTKWTSTSCTVYIVMHGHLLQFICWSTLTLT